jgi:hypothetical protein
VALIKDCCKLALRPPFDAGVEVRWEREGETGPPELGRRGVREARRVSLFIRKVVPSSSSLRRIASMSWNRQTVGRSPIGRQRREDRRHRVVRMEPLHYIAPR